MVISVLGSQTCACLRKENVRRVYEDASWLQLSSSSSLTLSSVSSLLLSLPPSTTFLFPSSSLRSDGSPETPSASTSQRFSSLLPLLQPLALPRYYSFFFFSRLRAAQKHSAPPIPAVNADNQGTPVGGRAPNWARYAWSKQWAWWIQRTVCTEIAAEIVTAGPFRRRRPPQ